ncbi:MAG TPA: hypothetical protein DCW88_10400 [Agrobacterium sp.]|uniref:hypothetical protein n=1 Tax=Agrobacterium pusense TaxID=648995 RepID=UPI000E8D090D|nr:hypothetical protein [Agrobacterium sp.]
MATNQYLPFGTAGGANVLSPTDYNALPARLSGFTAGTAFSVQLNTVWRQSSVVSAMVGEFITDYGGLDALDDGSVDNLETAFVRTMQKQPWLYAVAAGTANALTAALSPAPQSITAGMVIRLKISTGNTDVATLNLNGLGAAPIQTKFGAPLARGALTAGSVATLIFDGAAWRIADLSLSEIPVNFGQCRLSVQSATALLLSPYSGNSLVVNGSPVKIPSAGVTLSNSGLSANTVYNVYAFLSGATLTLEASGTAHSPDSSTGVEIKSGDPTRTLVGKIRTNATSNFADTTNYRGCINWFNRRQLNVTGGSGTNSTSSSSYIDLGGSISCSFLAWGDEALFSVVNGFARSDTVGGQANISLTLDGVQGFASDSGMQAPTANYNQALISTASYTPAEGWRTLSYVGRTGGPGNMTATMAIQTIVRG